MRESALHSETKEFNRQVMYVVQSVRSIDRQALMNLDSDGDGFVDGSANYQLIRNGSALDLRNRRGRTYSDRSSTLWDAVKAINTDSGFKVLLAGSNRFSGRFRVWDVSSSGVISSFSGWKSTSQALDDGWESLFGDVIQPDGTIGNPGSGTPAPAPEPTPAPAPEPTPAPAPSLDSDGDGFVDGSANYQLIRNGSALDLRNRRGRTYSDRSSTLWDAVKAINTDSGFKVLLAGSNRFSGRFRVWDVSSSGVISSFSGWKSTSQALDDGWESLFGDVIQPDGTIGNPSNDGSAIFQIIGTPEIDQTLRANLSSDDPDGNGTFVYTWQSSDNLERWTDVGSEEILNISESLLGKKVRIAVAYIDGEGFNEASTSEYVTISAPENYDDYSSDLNTTGIVSLGSTSTGKIEKEGDHDWFAVNLEENKNYYFDVKGVTLDDTYLNLRSSAGTILSSDDDGGDGYNSRIEFTATQSDKYYLDIGAYNDESTGTYSIFAEQIQTNTPTDDYTADTNTTGSVDIDSTNFGELEEIGDHDWFSVTLEENKDYYFNAESLTLDDTYLNLRNDSGTILSSDDDGGQGYNSRIEFTATQSGKYYLDIGAYNDESTGTYSISAKETANSTPNPGSGFNSTDGYGHVDASRTFEQLLNISLPDAPTQGGNLWGLDNINAPDIWTSSSEFSGTKGASATVAVIDTGVDLDHPEFTDRITAGYDFVDNDSIADDGQGHGTHVAGTIAGSHDDGTGISGVAPESQIMPIRVLDNNGYGWTSDIVAGIRWAADNGADVINLSLGGGGYSPTMADAIRYASEQNSVVVMASGNSGGSSPIYPAAHAANYGIAVGAVNQNRNFANFSNRAGSNELDYVTAPGVDIYSAVPDGNYAFYSGTSMATPHVAGIAALLKSHDDTLTPEFIEDLITGTASNSISNANQTFQEPATNTGQSQLLTLDTLENFKLSPGNSRLIGNLNGNMAARKSTINDLKKLNEINDNIDHFDVISSTRKNFITVELAASNTMTSSQILEDWLSSDKFNYFEIDTQMNII